MSPAKRRRVQTVEDPAIFSRIRAALPTARAVIAHGIDPTDNDRINDAFAAVAGDWPDMPDEACNAMVPYVDDIFVLGMAVGFLLDKTVLERPSSVVRVTAAATRGQRIASRRRSASNRAKSRA